MTNRKVLTTAILIMAISMSIAGTQDVFAGHGLPKGDDDHSCEKRAQSPEITGITPTIDGAILEWTQDPLRTGKGGHHICEPAVEFQIVSGTYNVTEDAEEFEVEENEYETTITGLECGTEYEVEITTTHAKGKDTSTSDEYETLSCPVEEEEEEDPEVVEVHCEVEYEFEMFLIWGERYGYGECIYYFSDGSHEEFEVHVEGEFTVGSLIDGFRTIDGSFHIEDYDENSLWLDETGSIEIDCEDVETEDDEEFEVPYCLETDVTVEGGEGIFSFLQGGGERSATGYFTTHFIFTDGYAYSTIWIFFGEEEEPDEDEVEPETEEENNNGGGGDDRHKTSPTSGNDWNTLENLVEGGITVDGVSFTLTDNWYTPFRQIQIETGSTHSFGVKTFAQNGGLMVQEIAFGITAVGDYANAEALIEVHYDWDKTILDVKVVQDTEVIDVSTLNVSTDQVKCRSDADAICYQTDFYLKFNEPLKDKVYAVKAFDMTRRTLMPHYFNEGINIFGDSLNPMLTIQLASTEKFEGLITITQIEKYSNIWTTEDGRIFDADNYFSQTNKVYQKGSNDGRGSLILQQIKDGQAYLASQLYFDSSLIQGVDGGFIPAIVDTDGDSREQTLQKLVWNVSG